MEVSVDLGKSKYLWENSSQWDNRSAIDTRRDKFCLLFWDRKIYKKDSYEFNQGIEGMLLLMLYSLLKLLEVCSYWRSLSRSPHSIADTG